MDKKRLIAMIVFVILIIVLIPLPLNENQKGYDYVGYSDDGSGWKFVTVQEGQGSKYVSYPKYSVDNQGCMNVVSVPGSLSYIEATFVIPERGTVLEYEKKYGNSGRTELYDSHGVGHSIKPLPSTTVYTNKYDISQFVGHRVTIRMFQSSDLGYIHWYYHNIRIISKPYTLWDNFNIFKNMLISALLVSILIGFLIGVSGSEFVSRSVNRIHMHIHENKISGMSFKNKYIRRFLKMSFHVLDVPMCVADKIGNVRLRIWIKITSVLFLSFTIIYVTYIVAYIVVMMVLALVIIAIIIWIIISLLGGSPSGGSIGGGGGSSGSSNSSSKDGYYEKDGKKYDIITEERIIKQDGRTYRDGFSGWDADKDIFGYDKVKNDIFGDPKIEKDLFGDQKIEKDFFGDPIIPPKKKK